MVTTEKMKGKILINPERCTGCRVCQLECSFKYHSIFSPALANIEILEIPGTGTNFSINYKEDCRECLTCARACVFGALQIEEGGN